MMLRRMSASKTQVHLLMDEEDVKSLEQLAVQNGESLSGLIRRVMKHYIRSKSAPESNGVKPLK